MMSLTCKSMKECRRLSRAFVAILNAQNMSTASTEAKPQRLSKNLSFREAYDSPIQQHERPLVFLYGWLVAKAKHIHKYGDYYLTKGYDVLHIKVNPQQLLWPVNAQDVVRQALDFAVETREKQPVLVHGFSVGAYLYGETLVHILNNDKYTQVGDRIRAQILDSPVDYAGIPEGVSKALTPNVMAQKIMQNSIQGYLGMFKKRVMAHYVLSSNTFTSNPLLSPSLMLYSDDDVIADYKRIEEVAEDWRQKGADVQGKRWKDSPHVGHFQKYPVEYITMLNSFLQHVGLVPEVETKERISIRQ